MRKFAVLLLIMVSTFAFAQPPVKEGFSGFVDAGIVFMQSNDSLKVNDDTEEISGTADNVESYNQKRVVLVLELKYKAENIIYHFGSPMQEAGRGILAGVTFLDGRSSVDVSAVFSPFTKTWKDPYATSRESTSQTSYGMRVKLDNIAESGFGTEFRVMTTTIGDDVSGETNPSMKREGETYSLRGNYMIPLGRAKRIIPFIQLTREERDGKAMSGNELGAGLRYMHKIDKTSLMPMITLTTMTYDAKDAVFDKTRQDDGYRAALIVKHDTPFDIPHTHASLILAYSDRMSNINFYDAQSTMAGVTFGVHF